MEVFLSGFWRPIGEQDTRQFTDQREVKKNFIKDQAPKWKDHPSLGKPSGQLGVVLAQTNA